MAVEGWDARDRAFLSGARERFGQRVRRQSMAVYPRGYTAEVQAQQRNVRRHPQSWVSALLGHFETEGQKCF